MSENHLQLIQNSFARGEDISETYQIFHNQVEAQLEIPDQTRVAYEGGNIIINYLLEKNPRSDVIYDVWNDQCKGIKQDSTLISAHLQKEIVYTNGNTLVKNFEQQKDYRHALQTARKQKRILKDKACFVNEFQAVSAKVAVLAKQANPNKVRKTNKYTSTANPA